MRCCVPFCNNTFDNESTAERKGISFHGFPSDALLRAAWLRALGKQDSQLPDSAVVCSQHFLEDDIYETDSGFTQICTGAVPSTVQVCMICLDTDSKLSPMTKHKLQEAYEKLTGYPLSDKGNLKQTICVQCAQRLISFNRFRDKSLRARALMMELVEKYELITRRHLKMINRTKHQLRSDFVVTTLGPDHYDLYILDPQEDKRTESDVDGNGVVKNEENLDTMSVNEDMEVANEIDTEFVAFNEENLSDNSLMLESKLLDDALYKALEINQTVADQVEETLDKIKCESAPLQNTLFSDEFVEHAIQNMHAQNSDGDDCGTSLTENKQAIQQLNEATDTSIDSEKTPAVSPLSTRLATNNETEVQHKEVVAVQKKKRIQATEINNKDISNRSAEPNSLSSINRLTNCIVKLYDIFKKPETKYVQIQDELLVKTETDISTFESQSHIDTASYYSPVISRNKHTRLRISEIGPVTNELKVNNTYNLKTSQSETNNGSNNSVNSLLIEKHWFICDVCKNKFQHKSLLVKHIKSHTDIKLFSCKFCKFKSKYEWCLNRHTQTHTGEKLFCCKFCEYRCMQKYNLICHIRTHTGEKPYACTLCEYKYARKDTLNKHLRTHTGEKPFSCKFCEYKSVRNCRLVTHMRTHTGEKPYNCMLCEYKSADRSTLVVHMRTHTGEKPYSCNLCEYKFAQRSTLVTHMKTHTDDKPFSCTLCKYKCARNFQLTIHMRTHTGEKPYGCKLCEYKFAQRTSLVMHMRTHNNDKPFSCTLCKFKCARNSQLTIHMRTHTGEKPFSCTLCKHKSARRGNIVVHMKTHTS